MLAFGLASISFAIQGAIDLFTKFGLLTLMLFIFFLPVAIAVSVFWGWYLHRQEAEKNDRLYYLEKNSFIEYSMEGVICCEKETKEDRRSRYHYSNYMRYKRLGNYPDINSWLAGEQEQKIKSCRHLSTQISQERI